MGKSKLWAYGKEQTYSMLEGIYGIELKSLGNALRELQGYMKLLTGSLGEWANMGKGRDRMGQECSSIWEGGVAVHI